MLTPPTTPYMAEGGVAKERPILFSGPMVRALLAGRKTQTRRVVKITHRTPGLASCLQPPPGLPVRTRLATELCPYGQPGDRLWVRENGWERPDRTPKMMREGADTWEPYYFDADGYDNPTDAAELKGGGFKRRPSIHMPRWASRILLEVTEVRAERLQKISEADCVAEGCIENHNGYFWGGPHHAGGLKQMATARQAYRDLWDSINTKPGTRWEDNPWLWAVSFRLASPTAPEALKD